MGDAGRHGHGGSARTGSAGLTATIAAAVLADGPTLAGSGGAAGAAPVRWFSEAIETRTAKVTHVGVVRIDRELLGNTPNRTSFDAALAG